MTKTTNGMEIVAQAWDNREGPAVLATVDAAKTPNAIYVGEIRYARDEGFVVADNYFSKTRANIKSGTRGAILFLTKDRKSFQVKGPLTYHTEGPIYENMRSWHDPKYPGVAATLLRVEEAYSGAEKLL
jgi:predicted pyridoxine 5'-phosphate oxidase superfamily flavin-nucleotide-binding protein